jgi:hypothetical protein
VGSKAEGEWKKLGVAHQFGAGHAEIPGTLKVSCHASIVPMWELACQKNYFDRSTRPSRMNYNSPRLGDE